MSDNRTQPLSCLGTIFAVVLGVAVASGLRCDRQKSIEQKVDILLQKSEPRLETRDVMGKYLPEKFYEINGQRVYLEVDGKPVEQYFAEPSKTN